jgi:hypothetical protein
MTDPKPIPIRDDTNDLLMEKDDYSQAILVSGVSELSPPRLWLKQESPACDTVQFVPYTDYEGLRANFQYALGCMGITGAAASRIMHDTAIESDYLTKTDDKLIGALAELSDLRQQMKSMDEQLSSWVSWAKYVITDYCSSLDITDIFDRGNDQETITQVIRYLIATKSRLERECFLWVREYFTATTTLPSDQIEVSEAYSYIGKVRDKLSAIDQSLADVARSIQKQALVGTPQNVPPEPHDPSK